MLFYSEIKDLLDPPPKKKEAQGYKWWQYGNTHKCLFISAACDLDFYKVNIVWFSTVNLQSNPFIENYNLIIAIFHAHISAFMIFFIEKKTNEVLT